MYIIHHLSRLFGPRAVNILPHLQGQLATSAVFLGTNGLHQDLAPKNELCDEFLFTSHVIDTWFILEGRRSPQITAFTVM